MTLGIDYGLGQSNINKLTGIRYGVIHQNSVNLDVWGDAEPMYGDPTCGQCGNSAIASEDVPDDKQRELWYKGQDFACISCERTFWSDQAYPDEPSGYKYESDGYKLTDCLDSDIFVLESPYYTYAAFCSPCVPGAGDLDTPHPDGVKCYCLGHDWFDGGRAPYPVYSVADGTEVQP